MTEFSDILNELQALHDKKQADYGTGADPFANIRASEQFGIPAWLGAIVRANDKVSRLQAFARKGKLANESVEDSLRDLAVYSVIALLLYREAAAPTSTPASVPAAASSVGVVTEGHRSGCLCSTCTGNRS